MNTIGRRILSIATMLLLFSSQCSWAFARERGGRDGNDLEGAASAVARTNLNLRSRDRVVAAGQSMNFDSATLQVGKTARTVTPTDLLTHAEHVALQQVLTSGQQSLVLGRHGNAVRGSFQLTTDISQGVHDVIVPRGVTAITDAASSALTITGNLINAGRLYAISSSPTVATATISAANIENRQGAVISSILPGSGLHGLTSAVSHLDLSLKAIHDIINYGTISSSGNLSMSAGGQLVNALPSGVSGQVPSIQAMGNVNLASTSIVNAGTIASITGSINIASQMTSSLLVQNTGGTLQALAGAINVGQRSVVDKINVSVFGGDLLSRELNMFAGSGVAMLNAGEVTGLVNIYAHETHVSASTDNLKLGTIQLTGDPTFFNTGGDVTMSSFSSSGADLAVVASKNIIINNATLDTGGGAMLLFAGANITSPSPADQQHDNDSGTTLTITGGSTTGGNISVTGNSSFKSNAATAGSITLIAFAGNTGTAGNVTFDSTSGIEAKGSGFNSNGNVLIIANGTSSGITVNTIDTTGGTKAGNVTISSSTANIGGSSIQIKNGSIISGGPFSPGSTPGSGNIHALGTLQAFDSFNASTGAGNITIDGALLAQTINLQAGATSTITIGSGSNTGIFSTGSAAGSDTITIKAGNISIPLDSSVRSGTGPLTDVPITFMAANLVNNGFISSSGDLNFQSFDGSSPLVVDGKTGQIFTLGLANLTNISGSFSFTQNLVFATFQASGLQLHQYLFNVTAAQGPGTDLVIDSLTTDHVTGSSITLTTRGDVSVGTLDATGTGKNSGGTVAVFAQNFEAASQLISGNSVDASATGTGDGGTISIQTSSNNPFEVCGATINSTAGHIAANGVNGGSLTLDNAGGQIVHAGCSVTANGTTGNGGTIFLTGTSPLNVTVDGSIVATNNVNKSGTIAINSGPKGTVNVNGTGTIQAGKSVKVGNINPTTLKFASPKAASVNIDPNLTIGNKVIQAGGAGPVLVASATIAPGSLAGIPFAVPAPPLTSGQQINGSLAIQKLPTDQTPVNDGSSFSLASNMHSAAAVPISQVIVATEVETDNFDSAFVSALTSQSPGTQIGSQTAGNYMELDMGTLLFAPKHDIVVKLVEGFLFIGAGSHVLVFESGMDRTGADPHRGESAVYDLHDLYKGAVRVVANKKEIVLTPGKQVVLTKKLDAKFEDVNPGLKIAYRNVRSEDVGGGIKAFAADFSIPSAMTRVDPLRRYLASKQGKNRAVANQLLKNAVLMANMSGSSEPYKSGQ